MRQRMDRHTKHLNGWIRYDGREMRKHEFYTILLNCGYDKLESRTWNDGKTSYQLTNEHGGGYDVPKMIFDNPSLIGLG